MDPKTRTQLVKAVKSFLVTIAFIAGHWAEEIIKEAYEQWLKTRAKKSKTTRSRARRKKS